MARKKKQEEPENMERWLVSYADFITLMFAFFVVMYSLSSVNEGKYKVLAESLVHAFSNPSELIKRESPSMLGTKVIPQRTSIIKKPSRESQTKREARKMKDIAVNISRILEPLVKEGYVNINQSKRGISIEINASLLFSPGEATLAPGSVKALTAVGKMLAKLPNAVQVEGYTDNIPIHTPQFPSNWELSTARASSVVRSFIKTGVPPDHLVAVGYADNHAVASNATLEGRARNRRVTVMILSSEKTKAASLPETYHIPTTIVPSTAPIQ